MFLSDLHSAKPAPLTHSPNQPQVLLWQRCRRHFRRQDATHLRAGQVAEAHGKRSLANSSRCGGGGGGGQLAFSKTLRCQTTRRRIDKQEEATYCCKMIDTDRKLEQKVRLVQEQYPTFGHLLIHPVLSKRTDVS